MKPLISKTEDHDSLQTLGRASVQIVHDLKNQLNGLKLYATFLRKRMDKSERPSDERETVEKLLAGLERAASDLSTLVQYGRPIELKRQSGVDLSKIMRGIASTLGEPSRATGPLNGILAIETASQNISGEFDPVRIAEALKAISVGAIKIRQLKGKEPTIQVRMAHDENAGTAVIEWLGLEELDHDPFGAFAGSDEIRMSLGQKIVRAHGGEAAYENNCVVVRLPLGNGTSN